jgi:hypothetical protein
MSFLVVSIQILMQERENAPDYSTARSRTSKIGKIECLIQV